MNFRSTFVCLLALACCANAQRFPGLPGIKDLINGISGVIGNLDNSLDNLFDDVKNFTKSLKEVADCYEADLKGELMDIFNGSIGFKSISSQYYKAFPNKTITREGIANLLQSTKNIITRCIDPTRRSSAKFGFTELSDKSLDEIQQLLGVQIPVEPSRAKRLSANDAQCMPSTGFALPSSFDWRARNAVTAVKNQAQCGSCWTFATAGAIESALVIARRADLNVDLSEQQMVNCAKPGGQGCEGGNSQMSFSYVKANGIGAESSKPYAAQEQSCSSVAAAYNIRDYCIRSKFRYTYSSVAEELTDDTIARALVQFGPLYIGVDASPSTYQNYRSGPLNARDCTTQINHAVLLVGYDSADNTWIIKNSWGTWWGDKGFFKLSRGQNTCGVRTEIAWPVL